MHVMITGGAGFIGRHTCKAFLSAGHTVSSFDLKDCPVEGVRNVFGSVMAMYPSHLAGVDVVVHLAGMLGVENTERRPRQCMDINAVGTSNVVSMCDHVGINRLIYTSSSEVYGEPDAIPIKETAELKPRSVYAVSKTAAEEYVKASESTPWTIIRPFNIYGPGQRDDFVISKFIKAAREGRDLEVYGNGLQTRAFCHVSDFARALVNTVYARAAAFQTFNIGNPSQCLPITEIARKVINYFTGTRFTIVKYADSDRVESREIKVRIPNIDKAETILGWLPVITLDEGIRTMIDEG